MLKQSQLAQAVILFLLPVPLMAQTYSKTEVITYHDNTTKWVLGQTATVTCVSGMPASTGCDNNAGNGSDTVSSTTFDATTALPLTTSAFGKLRSTTTYNGDGTTATIKDGNNKITTLSNWKRGIPQMVLFADNTSISAVVNDKGWIESVTDENGIGFTSSYGYDSMGRTSSITYPIGDAVSWTSTTRSLVPVASVEYGIAAGHWRETVTTGNAVKITYYDAMWRPLLVREYDSANVSGTERFTKTAYDTEGRVAFAAYPTSSVIYAAEQEADTGVSTYYDPLGRVTSVSQDSDGGTVLTTLTTYNTGFTTTVTNPRGYSTTSTYLTFDQPGTDWPLVINAPESATTTIARDTFGKPTSMTRSGGGVTPVVRSYAYYGSQELCRTVEPETGATLFGYDAVGNLTWSASGLASSTACLSAYNSTPTAAINARKASRTYDNRNRLLTLAFPDSNGNQTWTYTPDGLPSTVSTNNITGGVSNAVTNGYTYNKRRLLTGESMKPDTVQLGWGIGYGYNGLAQVVSEAYPASVSVNYTVNALGQTTQVTASSDGGAATTIASSATYFPNGALKQFTYGNGIVHTMTQNARQLPSQSVDGTILNLTTTFDKNGNVSAITDGTAAARQTRSMVYDQLDRLTSTTSPMFGTASYVYDTLDNLKQVNVSGGTGARSHYYCYNAANQLEFVRTGSNCSSSPSVINISYDVQGNLLQKTGTSGGTYTFDYGNRLRTATPPSASALNYRYDADGRRVRHDIAGASLKYSYYAKDGRLVWQRDEPGSKRISNIYFAGSLVAEYSRPIGSNTVTVNYMHTDALGSPIAKTNSSGSVIETSEYEPYGDLLNRTNDDRAGYTGHVMDAASGLTYMQQRYYDPQIGRFLSVDPVTADLVTGSNFNRYKYGGNNPYKYYDPDGRADINYFYGGDWAGLGGDVLNSAAEDFDIPGMTTVMGHSWATGYRFDKNGAPGTAVSTQKLITDIKNSRAATGDTGYIFLGGCSLGLGNVPAKVATTFNTSVISGFGYVVRERSSDGTITYRVKEKAKDKGKDKWFIITRPDGTSSGKIRSITMGPDGKISFTPFFEKEKEEKEEKDPLDPRNHR
ncbi:RHS repeat domain-containing protein [Thermomonas sp.]|jgi:RHS repeat-associated protein|uniref:RHS repeat domain-containing protein n=1 Tax=Thermomonas sp. TaxID=1971895 RepID=UPI0035B408F6